MSTTRPAITSVVPHDADFDAPQLCRIAPGATVYVPEHYEPNYAYPLLIWPSSAFEHDAEFADRMSAISTRNAFGLRNASSGESLPSSIRKVRERYNIHTERLVPIGIGEQAVAAVDMLLQHPDWFAGAVALNATFNVRSLRAVPFRSRGLRGKRALLGGHSTGADRVTRVLHAAGVDVHVGDAETDCWRQVDAWLIQEVCGAACR